MKVKIESVVDYNRVMAKRTAEKGEVILNLHGSLHSSPSKYSIQIEVASHLEPLEGENSWKFMNHSCNPNAFIDTLNNKIKALKPISVGEEICFNYNTTEYDIAAPFKCNCGSMVCYGEMKGFKHLSHDRQKLLLPDSAPHIWLLLDLVK